MTVLTPIAAGNPSISAVVPTIPANSHTEVVECLRNQTYDSYEVVVVNDASLDICEARNEGIRRADGEIVALTDDDCRPDPQWLRQICEKFEQRPNLVCLEGAVQGGRTYTGTRKYVGCNLAFDRQAALDICGFRSEYAGWRDDTEFGWRMERDAGGECAFSADAVMDHPEKPRASIDEELEAKLREEYPDRYEEILVPDTIVGRVNDWLWRKGFWDVIDSIRPRR